MYVCVAAGFATTGADDAGATLMCMVNPTNPTGDYMTVETIKAYIESASQPGMGRYRGWGGGVCVHTHTHTHVCVCVCVCGGAQVESGWRTYTQTHTHTQT